MLIAVDGGTSTGRLVRGVNKHDMEHMPYLDGLGSRREAQRSLHGAAKISGRCTSARLLRWLVDY
jgi:hypothetical protein